MVTPQKYYCHTSGLRTIPTISTQGKLFIVVVPSSFQQSASTLLLAYMTYPSSPSSQWGPARTLCADGAFCAKAP